MKRRIFLDTAYLLALINRSDEFHSITTAHYRSLIKQNYLLVTTEAILIETAIENGCFSMDQENTP